MMEEILREEINQYTNEDGKIVLEKKIYIKILEDKWISQKKYYENNKQIILKNAGEYKKNRYNTDEQYREKIKEKLRENYKKKKIINNEKLNL